jgi:hypothetical protein
MICILSPTYDKACRWANTQGLETNEWFYAGDRMDIITKINFHVIVVGEFVEPQLSLFEKLYSLARKQGQIGRY